MIDSPDQSKAEFKRGDLRCDYERHTVNSEAMIYVAMISLMLRRLA